jgi:Co/Zn/Cd efflux system component
VVSGFTNGILLVFVSLMVLGEGLGRLIGEPEIETEHLTAVAVAGFCVNLIGARVLLHAVTLMRPHVFIL